MSAPGSPATKTPPAGDVSTGPGATDANPSRKAHARGSHCNRSPRWLLLSAVPGRDAGTPFPDGCGEAGPVNRGLVPVPGRSGSAPRSSQATCRPVGAVPGREGGVVSTTFDPVVIEKLRIQWAEAPRHAERDAWDALYDALYPAPVSKPVTTCACGSMRSAGTCRRCERSPS